MNSRRDFLKKAALLSGGAGFFATLPASIQRAFAIDPEPGTTCFDAEHIVILMQENRSFDHAYGTLQGVRGFNDPRAITLPDTNPVWLQTNAKSETYAPFRLKIKETNATWMGSLPHSWTNQVDARNHGKHDKWLDSKRSGDPAYSDLPLTMGYYTREDIPFYYALADAFTICDQHFCSSLTGTMPNRLYFWTGTVRGVRDASAPAKVLNENVEYESSASWMTFPERLEDAGISWKIYQNELSLDVGMSDHEVTWLSNFGDNPLEWFSQYNARFSPAFRKELDAKLVALPKLIAALKAKLQSLPSGSQDSLKIQMKLDKAETLLDWVQTQKPKWSAANFEKLSERHKAIFSKAFCTNAADSDYHELVSMRYQDGTREREMKVPKGDVLYQFRRDVEDGTLPTVSWIVAPEAFSDHPSSAWFGAWYVSEVLDIMTKNPGIWKKSILALTYDENDGYFDHVPPFVAPHPVKSQTGAVSPGLNIEEDYVTLEQELKLKPAKDCRENSIGLGYRVPLVIASPWSRGGYVCSQVFDHTSMLQFLEKFVSRKSGRAIRETNISDWRRVVCGDLTSVFRHFKGEAIQLPQPVDKKPFLEQIHRAQFKDAPAGYKVLADQDIERCRKNSRLSPLLPKQEPGTRASCALPYELYAEGTLNRERREFQIELSARTAIFGARSAGSPFIVCAPGGYGEAVEPDPSKVKWEAGRNWNFAVAAGSALRYQWPLGNFQDSLYWLRVYGPNGFFREFKGNINDPPIMRTCQYQVPGGNSNAHIVLLVKNTGVQKPLSLTIVDNAYHAPEQHYEIPASHHESVHLDLKGQSGWYDFSVRMDGAVYEWRYAGRVESGRASITDPAMA